MTNTQNTLIQIEQASINGEMVQTVNARDLHAFLGVGKKFADWIHDRIQQFDFVENQDFIIFSQNGEKPQGGRPSKEYALTLDMAKELSMVERTAKGKEARRYFIECERRAKAAAIAHQETPEAIELENKMQWVCRMSNLYQAALATAKASGLGIIDAISAAEEDLLFRGVDISEMYDLEKFKRLARKNLKAQQLEQEKADRASATQKGSRASRKPESNINLYNYESKEYLTIEDITDVIVQKTGRPHNPHDLQHTLMSMDMQILDTKLAPYLTEKGREFAIILDTIPWGAGFVEKYAWTPEVIPLIEQCIQQQRSSYCQRF